MENTENAWQVEKAGAMQPRNASGSEGLKYRRLKERRDQNEV
jgi:hypothetical protein